MYEFSAGEEIEMKYIQDELLDERCATGIVGNCREDRGRTRRIGSKRED